MSQIHFGVVYDTETGEFSEAAMQEMPVDSDEYVWDDPNWRNPTEEEIGIADAASQALGRIFEFANDLRKGQL